MTSLFLFPTTLYCIRCGSKLVRPNVNTISFGINRFAYHGSDIWNNIPQYVRDATCLTHLSLDKMATILSDDVFNCIFLNENDRIPIKISLKYVPGSPGGGGGESRVRIWCFQIKYTCSWYEIWTSDVFSCRFSSYVCNNSVNISCSLNFSCQSHHHASFVHFRPHFHCVT